MPHVATAVDNEIEVATEQAVANYIHHMNETRQISVKEAKDMLAGRYS